MSSDSPLKTESSPVGESLAQDAPALPGDIPHVEPTQSSSLIPESTSRISLPSASSPARLAGIDLDAIGRAEARKIMSEEHKALGFRPPHGSLAAEAQAAAAKHPEATGSTRLDPEKLKEAARLDATRILAERGPEAGPAHVEAHAPPPKVSPVIPEVDLNTITGADARKLMSYEHRALGYRPPPGSLAAEAQAIAAKLPGDNAGGTRLRDEVLREAANRDAERIKAMREQETLQDPNDDKESGDPLLSAGGHASDVETEAEDESTPTPFRGGSPSVGVAPPLSRTGTDDSMEVILD